MKKVLIITYYWPPSGGAGVQRWLKFVKYLGDFGWEPVIYTPENPEAPATDESLLKDIPGNVTVLKQPIWEPYSFYKRFIGQKKEDKINAGFLTEKKKPGLAEKISVWIRGNWFIPDARKFWIKPSVQFLTGYLQKNKVDVIVSTGPPHSMHLIAMALKRKLNIPWLADFRDPWTTIDFYDKLMLSGSADAKHKELEKEVLQNADVLLTVGKHLADGFKKIVNREVDIITNGFDLDDFSMQEIKLDNKFSISHIGAMNADRNPHQLWIALSELVTENESLRNNLLINFIGKTDYTVLESLKKNNLHSCFHKTEYLPHAEITGAMQRSQVLLLALNNSPNAMGIVSGKLFEYLAAKRPILTIGEEKGDAAQIIKETNSGVICNFQDKQKMKTEITRLYNSYLQKNLNVQQVNPSAYERKNLTGKLAEVLNRISAK